MRHKKAPKRKILPDAKYGSEKISKFINYVMKKGKKTLAEQIVYQAFKLMAEKTKTDALKIFEKAIKNASPDIVVKARRIGGANYQIPMPAGEEKKFVLAAHWLVEAARERKGKSMPEKLAEEIIATSNGEGTAIKKKENLRKLADANKAFAYFARFVK